MFSKICVETSIAPVFDIGVLPVLVTFSVAVDGNGFVIQVFGSSTPAHPSIGDHEASVLVLRDI